MNPPSIPRWLPIAIVATALLSIYSISYRYRVEQRNRAVSIAIEYETVEAYAAAQGRTVDDALAQLKKQGLGSVVISEEYVGDLLNTGRATISSTGVKPADASIGKRLARAMSIRFAESRTDSALTVGSDLAPNNSYGNGISAATLRAMPVGLNPIEASTIRKAGLGIVARMANPAGVTSLYVRQTLGWAHELGASVFLPMGDQVLGRRDALADLTDELDKLGMVYASPEFTKLGGDQNVLTKAPTHVVRLHSAQAAELDKLTLDEAVDRYSRAARERGMRVLLVRPVSFASPQPLATLDDFIKKINLDCRRQGLDMGAPHPFEDPGVPSWLFLLIGLSIVPTAYFAGSTFVQSRNLRVAGLILVTAVCALAATNHGRPFTALLAALAFPTAAFIVLDGRQPRRESGGLLRVTVDFGMVSLISLVGGLAVAGLLNSLPYFIRAQQFEGVKLAVFLPIALVALYFIMRGTDLKAILKDPVTWGSALMALLILAALLFMSSRTGNDNPGGVSDTELKMRFLLDQILFVRPRTKEFMVGHPLLILGIALFLAQRRNPNPRLAVWTALALAGGAIGQTDIVNTMCHIHTPIMLSLMRIGVGMVAGCIIGLAARSIAKRFLPAGVI